MTTSNSENLATRPIALDTVGLLEGITSTRAIRRYQNEQIPDHVLRDILFAATRAPSGSNRQPFRFLVLRDGPKAKLAKSLIAKGGQQVWSQKRKDDGYDAGSGTDDNSPKARTARTMQRFVDDFANIPVLILPCLVRYRAPGAMEAGSIYPAVQNILLAARGLGYGGVLTGWQSVVESELRQLLEIPEDVLIAGTISLGKPEGHHGQVRRRPISELIYEDSWESPAPWAIDPPGTTFTSAGPPKNK